ncbi:MAG: hypothetical protein ACXWLY_06540 [Thermoanaerobaculia bacterium]
MIVTLQGCGREVRTLVSTAGTAQVKVAITSPVHGSHAVERLIVEGTVSDPKAAVWIVVHPLEVSDYWVQPRISVRENGSWKVQINIGRTGPVDVGKLFEIRAVSNPKADVREGLVLDHWPESTSMSDVIEVTRR